MQYKILPMKVMTTEYSCRNKQYTLFFEAVSFFFFWVVKIVDKLRIYNANTLRFIN